MVIKTAVFKCSSEKISQCPADGKPEIAFIGRSNVGKSPLINMLTGVKGLAKVSGVPGKTRLINHFLIDNKWFLVDLPGYGYAKVSKDKREGFSRLIMDYVVRYEHLFYLFVLVDSRLEPQKIDLEFIRFLGENGIPFGIVFTKTDKLSSDKVASRMALYKRVLKKEWEELPDMFATSSENKAGKEELLCFIDKILEYKE